MTKTDVENKIKEAIEREICELFNHRIISSACYSIDKQCKERFGLNWDEIKKQVFNDLESISRWHSGTRDEGGASKYGLNANSGNWMINELLRVHTYKRLWEGINSRKKKYGKTPSETLSDSFEQAGIKVSYIPPISLVDQFNDLVTNITAGKEEIPRPRKLRMFAVLFFEDRIKNMLKSHNLID